MNQNQDELENHLRRAPAPRPPRELEGEIRARINLATSTDATRNRPGGERPSFWNRWWPVLVPGLATVALAAVVGVQQLQLDKASSSQGRIDAENTSLPPATANGRTASSIATTLDGEGRGELERLRAKVRELAASLATVDALVADNARLQAELAAIKGSRTDDQKEMEETVDRANRIKCVNNMKQLGLAVRIFANDNHDDFPPDLKSILTFLGSPEHPLNVMVCPDDTGRQPAPNAAAFTDANCSYEFLAPGPGKFETEPQRVMFKCRVHGNVTLCDGSVQQLTPERLGALVTRDGKLYLE